MPLNLGRPINLVKEGTATSASSGLADCAAPVMFEIGSGGWLAVLAVIGLFNSLAVAIVGAYVNARLVKAVENAKEDAEKAKTEHNESTVRLIKEARSTRDEVSGVGRVAEETLGFARASHDLLNGEHTKLRYTIMILAERIARDHHEDAAAQAAAIEARKNYDKARQ